MISICSIISRFKVQLQLAKASWLSALKNTVKTIYSKTKHTFKSCNIYLKPEHFCKSKFYIHKQLHYNR